MIITLIAAVFGVVSSARALKSTGELIWPDKIEISDLVHNFKVMGIKLFPITQTSSKYVDFTIYNEQEFWIVHQLREGYW